MTATMTGHAEPNASEVQRRTALRRVIAGAAPFDAVMGIGCLALADRIGGWLSIGTGSVAATGAVFLAAGVAGAWTLWRGVADTRPIVAANGAFAVWCLGVLAVDGPNGWGAALLVVSALASGATAVLERRLATAG